MAGLSIPQKDSSSTRKSEIETLAATYKYVEVKGVPLIETEGPLDKNKPDWYVSLLVVVLKIRNHMDDVVKRNNLKFEKELAPRKPKTWVEILKQERDPTEYFAPDLGAMLPDGRPKDISDYTTKIFGKIKVPSIAARFDTDEQFAYTFLAGPNPNQIKRMTKPIAEFPISNTQLQSLPEFASDDLGRAMAEGRIYYVDHSGMKILKNGVHPQGPKYQYAPFAAFAVPRQESARTRLFPFAIQCGPTPEGRMIYQPSHGYSWKMARNCVLSAHNNHHEVVTHLGLTHLLVDAVVAATRRKLHVNHPVHALLDPHFEGTAAINIGARTTLIQPGASVDRLVGSDILSNYDLLGQERLAYSYRDNYLPNRLKRLQVDDAKLIKSYPYRDDAILIWNATHNWVSDYVEVFYKSDADIRADAELQAWAKEATVGGRIKDFGVAPGTVRDRNDLIDILTMTIFTAGPQHAAVNFTQGSDMSFVPANPLAGYVPEPQGTGHTAADWLAQFPPLDVALHTLTELTLLAGIKHGIFGAYGTSVIAAAGAKLLGFQAKLLEIENTINNRNRSRVEYIHLKPSRIPPSINI